MYLRIRRILNRLQAGLWFIPSLIVAGLVALAFFMVWLDSRLGPNGIPDLPGIFSAGPEGTRDMLTTIASSMLTVASVAFSFTIVVFSFASSQYASRTLHSFMDDNTNQVVLGTLLGSFVYCLLILRSVRLETGNEFVPVLSATMALALAIVDLGLFILFIHHVSEAIQAYHIIWRVGHSTGRAINSLFPRTLSRGASISEEDTEAMLSGIETRRVRATGDGYVQAIDARYMLAVAARSDLIVVQRKGVGSFVVTGERLADVGPASRITPRIEGAIRDCFFLGQHRTIFQDPQYGILQLSDIALKALSPAINDPNTAIMALNEISKVLRQVARRELPKQVVVDERGNPRVVASVPTFEQLASQAFDQIRRFSMGDASVPAKILDVLTEIGEEVELQSERDVLGAHALAVVADARRAIQGERDRSLINAELPAVRRVLSISKEELPDL